MFYMLMKGHECTNICSVLMRQEYVFQMLMRQEYVFHMLMRQEYVYHVLMTVQEYPLCSDEAGICFSYADERRNMFVMC
jgi:hypothetical protein